MGVCELWLPCNTVLTAPKRNAVSSSSSACFALTLPEDEEDEVVEGKMGD